MQLHQHTPFHSPRAGSLLQFLITPCMLIWNINQTFTSRDTFSFHAGMLSCVYETSKCVCQSIKQGWCVSPYRQSLISYLQNLQNICKLMLPLAKEWKPLCLTQTRLALCDRGGMVHWLILLLFKIMNHWQVIGIPRSSFHIREIKNVEHNSHPMPRQNIVRKQNIMVWKWWMGTACTLCLVVRSAINIDFFPP